MEEGINVTNEVTNEQNKKGGNKKKDYNYCMYNSIISYYCSSLYILFLN